ncbi:hypothetical protein niasHS_002786 [Heterodera schachtii]|uniref:Pre-rRNA-processing protein TSR2 homolog n=1 Tax=Heterodera schachtii TaxID=97005 RepID=A0ABD2K2F7_HETSC
MAQNTAKIEEFVRLVLSSWPSYQFAIKNQLAGSLTSAKDAWFVEELSAHLLKHKNICPFALSDWMEDILDMEFSLISDDGTLEPTAKLLVELADLTLERGAHKGAEAAAKLEEHLQRLRTLSAKSSTNSTTPRVESSSSESEENDGSDEEND